MVRRAMILRIIISLRKSVELSLPVPVEILRLVERGLRGVVEIQIIRYWQEFGRYIEDRLDSISLM